MSIVKNLLGICFVAVLAVNCFTLGAAAETGAAGTRPAATRPVYSKLQMRYARIYGKLDEVKEVDAKLVEMRDTRRDEASTYRLMAKEKWYHRAIWKKVEKAAGEVAVKHGRSDAIPAGTPELPEDLTKVDDQELLKIIRARMVIEIDDGMADEVVKVLNERYRKEKAEEGKVGGE
jgi:hypothetical protein